MLITSSERNMPHEKQRLMDCRTHMTRTFPVAAFAAFFMLASTPSQALGPHECAILVNRNSPASMALANVYADLRNIPPQNIVHLDIPDKALEPAATITPDEFRRHIYEPAMKTLAARNLPGHVLVWLYSLDFPSTIATDPPMSLTGMTFVRGQPPPPDDVMSGRWPSPLFRGPDRPDGPTAPSVSLEQFTIQLTTNMPLPAMMLGWHGSRGMTLDQIKDQLRGAAGSDGSHPKASVYFELNDNIRSTTRTWQFEPSIRELTGRGVTAVAASNQAERLNIMGVMAGRASLDVRSFGPLRFGAYADHLTSFGALFHEGSQTKLTAWLRAGAAASSGTVVEPGSTNVPVNLWPKFAAARFFTHYTGGCTMIESLYQSVRSPLQILLVGDALCSPWSKSPGLTLISLADDDKVPLRGRADFMASAWAGAAGSTPPLIMYMLNGQPLMAGGRGNTPHMTIDTTRLSDGYHELRAIGYMHDAVRQQGFARKGFTVCNRDRSITLAGYQPKEQVDLFRPLTFTVSAKGRPDEVAIIAQERELVRLPYRPDMVIDVSPQRVGAGPVSFQSVAYYDGREGARSPPLLLHIAELNKPPVIGMHAEAHENGTMILSMQASDPENDPVQSFWVLDVMRGEPCTPDAPHRIKEIQMAFQFTGADTIHHAHQAGIAFNQVDDHNYFVWGADGRTSAWSLRQFRDGAEAVIFARGAPLETKVIYTLRLTMLGPERMGLFVNDSLLGEAEVAFGPGRIEIRTGSAPVDTPHMMIAPPLAVSTAFREEAGRLIVESAGRNDGFAPVAMARDHRATSFMPHQGPGGDASPD